jgi:hypothetical protein
MMAVLYEIYSLINFDLGLITIGRLLRLAVLSLRLYIYIMTGCQLKSVRFRCQRLVCSRGIFG